MHWLAEGDPVKLKAIEQMTAIDFFILLDKKIAQTKKELSRIKKNGSTKTR